MKSLIPIIIAATSLLAYSIYIQPSIEAAAPGTTALSPQATTENIADYPLSKESGYNYPLLMEGGYWNPCGAGECD